MLMERMVMMETMVLMVMTTMMKSSLSNPFTNDTDFSDPLLLPENMSHLSHYWR